MRQLHPEWTPPASLCNDPYAGAAETSSSRTVEAPSAVGCITAEVIQKSLAYGLYFLVCLCSLRNVKFRLPKIKTVGLKLVLEE